MCSVTVQTLVLVVNRLYTQPLNAAWGIIVLSSILIWNMAPVQSINRELDADEKRHCRKVAVKIIAGIYVFAGWGKYQNRSQLICLSIPALFTQRFTDLQQLSYVDKSNIKQFLSVGTSPMIDNRPSFKGITTPLLAECPLALLCSNFNNRLA